MNKTLNFIVQLNGKDRFADRHDRDRQGAAARCLA